MRKEEAMSEASERDRGRELGMDTKITRREFIDGVAVVAGAATLAGSATGVLAGCGGKKARSAGGRDSERLSTGPRRFQGQTDAANGHPARSQAARSGAPRAAPGHRRELRSRRGRRWHQRACCRVLLRPAQSRAGASSCWTTTTISGEMRGATSSTRRRQTQPPDHRLRRHAVDRPSEHLVQRERQDAHQGRSAS